MSEAKDADAPAPVKMGYKRLGKTSMKVSELSLGCMTFSSTGVGGWGLPAAQQEESFRIMNRYVEAGGNFLDTADVYGAGDSERVVGSWLSTQTRDELVIATKCGITIGPGPNQTGLSRKHIMASIEGSLERLNTPYVDLYQAHKCDPDTPIEETMRAFNDLVRCGKVRYIGLSNYPSWQIARAQEVARSMGLEPVVSLQQQYSLLARTIEWDIIPVCEAEDLGVLPWSPLAGGWLSGKYTRAMALPTAGTRVAWAEGVKFSHTDWTHMATEHTWGVVDKLVELAEKHGRTPAQVALRWVMQRPRVVCPIIGAKNLAQLEDNLAAVSFSLPKEDMDALTAASNVTVPYPWAKFG